jgi:hypothetical protein
MALLSSTRTPEQGDWFHHQECCRFWRRRFAAHDQVGVLAPARGQFACLLCRRGNADRQDDLGYSATVVRTRTSGSTITIGSLAGDAAGVAESLGHSLSMHRLWRMFP